MGALVSLGLMTGCSQKSSKCILLDKESYASQSILDLFENSNWEIRSEDSRRGCGRDHHVTIYAKQFELEGGHQGYLASSVRVSPSTLTHPMTYMAFGSSRSFSIEHVVNEILADLDAETAE